MKLKISLQGSYIYHYYGNNKNLKNKNNIDDNPIHSFVKRCFNNFMIYNIVEHPYLSIINKICKSKIEKNVIYPLFTTKYKDTSTCETKQILNQDTNKLVDIQVYKNRKSHIYDKKISDSILENIIQSTNIDSFKDFYEDFYKHRIHNDDTLYISILITESNIEGEFIIVTKIIVKLIENDYNSNLFIHHHHDHDRDHPNNRSKNIHTYFNERINSNIIEFYYDSYDELLTNINIDNPSLPNWLYKYDSNHRFRRTKGIMVIV
jgi:hypothetical protein